VDSVELRDLRLAVITSQHGCLWQAAETTTPASVGGPNPVPIGPRHSPGEKCSSRIPNPCLSASGPTSPADLRKRATASHGATCGLTHARQDPAESDLARGAAPSRLRTRRGATLRRDAHFAVADGLFWAKADAAALVEDFRESSNDTDSRRNRPDRELVKFPFEIKSANS
jgi:hypothetical protein